MSEERRTINDNVRGRNGRRGRGEVAGNSLIYVNYMLMICCIVETYLFNWIFLFKLFIFI